MQQEQRRPASGSDKIDRGACSLRCQAFESREKISCRKFLVRFARSSDFAGKYGAGGSNRANA
jgi:hypothetical protein